MKNLFFAACFHVFVWMILPVLAIAVSVSSMTGSVSQPSAVAVVAAVDSGERWWDPTSWSLDESAAQAVAAANLAANVAQVNSTTFSANLVSALYLGLLVAVAVTVLGQQGKPAYEKLQATAAAAKAELGKHKKEQEAIAAAAAAKAELVKRIEAQEAERVIADELPPSAADVARHARRQTRHPAEV